MGLRLIGVPLKKKKVDVGTGEFGKKVKASKYYRDKCQTIVAKKQQIEKAYISKRERSHNVVLNTIVPICILTYQF